RQTLDPRAQLPPRIPPGLPTALLQRRPDILEAEQLLVSANADIGAAKALFFPTISLTGFLGGVSGDLTKFLGGDGAVWALTPGLFQPIFQGGRIRRNVEAQTAEVREAAAQAAGEALHPPGMGQGERTAGHRHFRRARRGGEGRYHQSDYRTRQPAGLSRRRAARTLGAREEPVVHATV